MKLRVEYTVTYTMARYGLYELLKQGKALSVSGMKEEIKKLIKNEDLKSLEPQDFCPYCTVELPDQDAIPFEETIPKDDLKKINDFLNQRFGAS